MQGIDGWRSGTGRTALPRAPKVLWRARLSGGAGRSIAVDAKGSVIVAGAAPVVSELDSTGKERWSVRLGSDAAGAGPVLTSDQTRVVLTLSGEVIALEPSGSVRYRARVGAGGVHAAPLPTRTGGIIAGVTDGMVTRIVWFDRDGNERSHVSLSGRLVAILDSPRGTTLVTDDGTVRLWRPPSSPSRVGSLGGRPDAEALFDSGNSLAAVIANRRVVSLDLRSGRRSTVLPDGRQRLEPSIASSGSSLFVTSVDGTLLSTTPGGKVSLRVPLEPLDAFGDGGATRLPTVPPSVVVGSAGRVAFARPGLDVGVVDKTGAVAIASRSACAEPTAIAPLAAGRMVVACASGAVLALGD